MDYATFQRRGSARWREAEVLLERAGARGRSLDHEELDTLAALHRAVAADYAWVRTHHPGSALAGRLRALAFRGHRVLAPPEPPLRPRVAAFLRHGYPAAFRREADFVLASAALLLLAALVGAVGAALEPRLVVLFVGEDAWASMAQGRLWTDEIGRLGHGLLASSIFTNNIAVALFAWAGGLLLGFPTLYVLLVNGFMLGAILVGAAHHGLLGRLLAFIALHGPLELFLVAVAGGGGLLLARGEVLRDGRPRAAVLGEHAVRSLTLVGGTIPWFVLLGLLEGWVSASDALASPVRAGLGLGLFVLFLAWALRPARPEGP